MIRIGLLLLCVPAIWLMWVSTQEWNAVAQCLAQDMGYDYVAKACSADVTEAPTPLMRREPLFVNSLMILSTIGFVMCVLGLYRRRS